MSDFVCTVNVRHDKDHEIKIGDKFSQTSPSQPHQIYLVVQSIEHVWDKKTYTKTEVTCKMEVDLRQ